jgi:hypothetical protein
MTKQKTRGQRGHWCSDVLTRSGSTPALRRHPPFTFWFGILLVSTHQTARHTTPHVASHVKHRTVASKVSPASLLACSQLGVVQTNVSRSLRPTARPHPPRAAPPLWPSLITSEVSASAIGAALDCLRVSLGLQRGLRGRPLLDLVVGLAVLVAKQVRHRERGARRLLSTRLGGERVALVAQEGHLLDEPLVPGWGCGCGAVEGWLVQGRSYARRAARTSPAPSPP